MIKKHKPPKNILGVSNNSILSSIKKYYLIEINLSFGVIDIPHRLVPFYEILRYG